MATEERAADGVSVYWLVVGALIAFGLSLPIFIRVDAIVPKLPESWSADQITADSAGEPAADPVWSSGKHTSDTDIEDYGWAISPLVASQGKASFLSRLPAAQIRISCGIDWEFVSLEFSRAPDIIGATPIGGGFDRISANVEWDGEAETVEFLREHGSKTMSFADSKPAITKLAQARTMLLTLRRASGDSTQFVFPLEGSATAIDKMWRSCR